ncbi:uncharacterized protein LOC119547427 [Drosophila subpulchrella]|uniref:uncharacterized protein LOC119547427 n=1 Tax=Drosophila subpulchrella TaxID=1486046 RepID=UPI0018A1A8ED|nr:uncharacterized protein LOC119547427 [Drosophila subpulchrella]
MDSDDCSSGSDLSSWSNSTVGDVPTASSCTLQACPSKRCNVECCEGDPSRPPYTKVMPEDRRYGVVVSNEEDPCCCQFTCVLQFLLKSFHTVGDEVSTLRFSECTSVEQFDCNLIIVGRDDHTKDWLITQTRGICPPFKVTSFIRHFELVKVSFVIPQVVDVRLCRIFNIFEKQLRGLDTGKWCVVKQTPLDECSAEYQSKVVYPEVKNVEILAYIDEESADIIKRNCSKICYMLFHLPVDFCPRG